MKKTVLALIILSILIGFSAPSLAEEHKTYGQVLQAIGLIQGDGGDIKEEDFITREELTTLLVRTMGKNKDFQAFELPKTPTFSDVPADHWAAKYIEFAYQRGITGGIGDGKFGLGERVTYNQASLFMLKNLNYNEAKAIDYATASQQIADKYGLKLDYRTIGGTYLLRGQVFELLAKSLTMKPATATGFVKIDLIGLSEQAIKRFHQEMKSAKPFMKKSELQSVIKGEFFITDLGKVTDRLRQGIKDEWLKEDYRKGEVEAASMKYFAETYLNSDYKVLPLKESSILMNENEYGRKEIEFETPNLGIYDGEVSSHGSKIEIDFHTWEDSEIPRFGVDVSSVSGRASTGGYVTEIRQYQDKNNLKVFVILGADEYDYYKDGRIIDLLYPFYTAFTVDEHGFVVECITSAAYGTGYHNYGKRYPKDDF